MRRPLRGQILLLEEGALAGAGGHPVLVVSSDFFNARLQSAVVLAITSADRSQQAGCVALPRAAVTPAPGRRGLDQDSFAVCHSPHTVPLAALGELLGSVSDAEVLARLEAELAFALDLGPALE